MENLTKILTGTSFKYNSEMDYEKDGHAYCKTCNERVDSEPSEFLDVKDFVHRKQCKCRRDEIERAEKRKKAEKIKAIKEKCFINKNQMNYTFDNADDRTDKGLLTKTKNYANAFDEMLEDNIGLFLFGSVGSGKTYLACAIANEIIEKHEYRVKMKNFAQILNDLQSGGFNLDRNEYINTLTSPKLLILDDFGIERNTEYALENIYNVINARYLKAKPTIITTNLDYGDIEKEQESVSLARIYSRLLEMCLPLKVVSKDRRKEIRQSKLDKASKRMNGDD